MDKLQERAEEFAATGFTRFRRWELLTWFGQERVSKNIWRSINDHFLETAPARAPKGMEVGDEFIFFDDKSAWKLTNSI